MFKKLQEKWKQEWWEKRQDDICREYSAREKELKADLEEHLEQDRQAIEASKASLSAKELEIEMRSAKLSIRQAEIEELEVRVAERKFELLKADNDLKAQIKLLEAKASPTAVWTEAFSLGVSKTWDLLLPVMTGNIEALKKKIYEDATFDSIARLNGKKK